MRIDVLLVEGGREKNSKGGLGIESVLSRELKIARVWLDEHGWWWLIDGDNNRRISIMANRIVEIDQTELIIGGGWEMGIGIDRVWPLNSGYNFSKMGIKAVLELAGVDMIGTGSVMSWICEEREMSKLVFTDVTFDDKKTMLVTNKEWESNHLHLEDKIGSDFKFPLVLEHEGKSEKVSIFENLANMIFKIFEEGASEIEIRETGPATKLAISFIGRVNFLPSKLCAVGLDGQINLAEDKILEREMQNLLMSFVKKYDVKDYGIFYINNYIDGWKLDSIDLSPDFSIDGLMANIWSKSGFNYQNMINKIFKDASIRR